MPGIKRKRFFAVLLAEAFCLLLLLPGCFKKEEEVYSFYGEDIAESMIRADGYLEFQSERMELKAGVYEVRVRTSLEEDQKITVQMGYDRGYFHSLRGNVVRMFPGHKEMDFNFYVLDKVPSAYVECQFFDVGAEGMEELYILRTNKGNRVLLFLAAAVFAALDFLVEFRRRILDGRVTKRQQVVFWTLTAGVLLAYFPYLTDYFIHGADTFFHISRIAWLKETLEQGTSFPVRIQSHWLYGHGYAVSLFYCDLFLFLPAALHLIGFSILAAYKIFILIILAATAVIAYWSFYQCVKDEYAALFGSMIYLLIPYHIYNFYNRGAIGECLAMIFLPLIAAGMYLLYTQDVSAASYKRYKWYIIWGVSAVIECHVISTELTAFVMAVFCVIGWRKTFRKETFLQLAQAVLAAALLTVWFWLPLLYMMHADRYHLQTIVSKPIQEMGVSFAGILQLLPNKGAAQTGMWQCEPIQLGAAVLVLMAVYLLWRKHSPNRACKISAAFCIVTVVMSTQYLPWDRMMKLPVIGGLVSSLQFPWRWMILATCFAAMFAAFFWKMAWEEGSQTVKLLTVIAAFLAVGSAVYHVNDIAFVSAPVYLYDTENFGTIGVGSGEYLLEETGIFALDVPSHDPVAEEGLEWSDYTQRGTKAKIYLSNQTDGLLYVELPLTGYQGYKLKTWEQQEVVPYITEEVGAHGDLKIAVPAGYSGGISVFYGGFPIFHAAEAVSLATLAAMAAGCFYQKRRKRKGEYENRAR